MRCFFAPETDLHDPIFRLTHGTVQQNAERPERARLLKDALAQMGFRTEEPPEAPRSALEAVHTPQFLDFLETAWEQWQALPGAGPEVVPNVFPARPPMGGPATYPDSIVARAGWHMGDTSAPIGKHSWNATRRAADCAIAAADAVLEGDAAAYALCRPAGHHTGPETAAGHCLINNSAVAAARLLTRDGKVSTLDIDVHHGNGTQAIFYERADVLCVSIHADPADYYPFFTGHADETGGGTGAGANLNIPLPRSTTDAAWLAALRQALDAIDAFSPGALMVSLGLDAHENDPLLGMKVTWEGFEDAGRMIAAAHYPTVLVQEGGYLSDDLTTSLVSFLRGFEAGLT
ncbi:acetylpolyamine amidohydrolase [Salipiger pallidus]|uniref:Acetylpolyamine amidohydrolase n=1 Tax=Salipiger pallidus TaxID=1775170 RepID=A0A8J2ZHX2_9RHOB|nr:histone deacetylase family protein [Salipiger pallidus]GGG65938.1 acetylpolyamine amidohydrolase [Salipiger pallidus]